MKVTSVLGLTISNQDTHTKQTFKEEISAVKMKSSAEMQLAI